MRRLHGLHIIAKDPGSNLSRIRVHGAERAAAQTRSERPHQTQRRQATAPRSRRTTRMRLRPPLKIAPRSPRGVGARCRRRPGLMRPRSAPTRPRRPLRALDAAPQIRPRVVIHVRQHARALRSVSVYPLVLECSRAAASRCPGFGCGCAPASAHEAGFRFWPRTAAYIMCCAASRTFGGPCGA